MRYIFIARRPGNFSVDCIGVDPAYEVKEIFYIEDNLSKDELVKTWASFLMIYLDELIKHGKLKSEDRKIEFYIYENGLQIWNNNGPVESNIDNLRFLSSPEELESYKKDYIEYAVKIYKEAIDLAAELLEEKVGFNMLSVLNILKEELKIN